MVTYQSKVTRTILNLGILLALFLALGWGGNASARASSNEQSAAYTLVFVSRKLSNKGSVYYPSGGIMPGVAGYSRFQVAAPGKLIIREANGNLRTLINGSNPTVASLNLIDVNAPDVSYDGTKILFAGIAAGNYSTGPLVEPGAWRIYVVNIDGTGLKQLTFSDRNIDLSQFGSNANLFTKYDDTDPIWLPDGRIAFSSTRWPSFGMYGAVHATNLYVMDADGTNMHRITAERNGADRAIVDPLTGKIVYSRWWRNFRTATNSMETVSSSDGGFIMKDGLCAINHSGNECQEVGGLFNLDRNAWHLATINPDGTGLVQFAGRSNTFHNGEIANHAYGGAFALDGGFYANFFPMSNGTEAAGFGGIKRFSRGANGYTSIIGITTRDETIQQFVAPGSYGVYVGEYAADPAVLPDGRLVISWAKDTAQDYGIYIINADGSSRTLLYDNPGTTELRTRVVIPRPIPPIVPDKIINTASLLPPKAQGPYDIDGSFQFQALNVYFNAPVDTNIISAPSVGSANTIRFFADFQRAQQRGSFETLDFPVLLQELLINPDGSVTANLPANIPLFEQIRTLQANGYQVPLTSGVGFPGEKTGAGHVAGLNYGRPGDTIQCVGCHAGHTLIPVPANPADAQWTNLATGAQVTVSSGGNGNALIDRRVKAKFPNGNFPSPWLSQSGQSSSSQWAKLVFPVPVTIRMVRLYDVPETQSDVNVLASTVRLYSDAAGTIEVANSQSGPLSEDGINIGFDDVLARVVRVEINSISGSQAGLAEVEVIARGESSNAAGSATSTPVFTLTPFQTPAVTATSTFTPTPTSSEPFISTEVTPAAVAIGATALVSVNLNNVPAEGYQSAEFACTYDPALLEKSDIAATTLFGADAAVAIHDPQNGTFIVAMAGTNGNKAMVGGTAFTFHVKGLQVGQSPVHCAARVSKGDHVPLDLPSTAASMTVQTTESTPTMPADSATATPGGHDHEQPTATAMPVESPTALPPTDGVVSGQVIANKPVTVNLLDGNNVIVQSVAANPDGTFILTALPGTYTIVAAASGSLSHQGSVTITAGVTSIRPAITLLAGDIDGNNAIDQFDALTIGMSYTSASPSAADLNNDGVIDFLDLELLAENYRKTGPIVWE